MKKLWMVVLAVNLFIQLNAQDDPAGKNCDQKIIIKTNALLPISTYYVGGKKKNSLQVHQLLNAYPPSALEFKSRQKMHKYFNFCLYPTLALYAATMVTSINNPDKKNNVTAQALLCCTFGGATACIVFGARSQRHYQKSIRLYNQKVCDW